MTFGRRGLIVSVMKKQIALDEAVGKTLTGVAESWGRETALIFGGEFVNLVAVAGYEGSDSSIEERPLDPLEFGDEQIIESGIVTAEELQGLKDAREERYRIGREAEERRTYEELRRKFG